MANPPLSHHSTMALHFYGGPGFLCKHSQLQISSLPSTQAVSLQPTAVLSLCLLSKPHVPAPSPHLHQWTHISGWGTQGCGTDHLCRSHSVLLVTDQLLCSPLIAPEAPLLSQLISLPVRGLPQMWETLVSFSSPKGVQVPLRFISSPFSLLFSFVLPGYAQIFLVLLVVRGPLLVFSWCSN